MSQIDLEDLIARCRGNRARAYVQEAVDCYRVGVYRAAVITTWIAVVYDIVDKLREWTAMEVTERKRLQEDRNRCAHPNLIREAEVYSPGRTIRCRS